VKRILITGVAGFIGSNLAHRLVNEAYPVVGIDNLSAGLRQSVPSRVEFFQADVRNPEIYPLFAGVDSVFHLAAKTCLPECHANPVETSDVNVTGTANALEAARRSGVRKFVYADTGAEYEGVRNLPSRVETIRPLSIYAISKRGGALLCEGYRELFGITVTTLRYFNVYGPGQDWRRSTPPVMSTFILQLLNNQAPTLWGTGMQRRDFIYIDDVNDFHMLALEDDRTDNRVFNVGSGVNYSIREILSYVAELLQLSAHPVHVPDLPLSPPETLADISGGLALGWRPRTEILDGIRKSIEYLKPRATERRATAGKA
jgi:UDP-glucose 4-epimerase